MVYGFVHQSCKVLQLRAKFGSIVGVGAATTFGSPFYPTTTTMASPLLSFQKPNRNKSSTRLFFSSERNTLKSKSSDTSILTTANAISFPTIQLKRNNQSKAFRNGNQLVFTKAINNNTTTTKIVSSLQMGDLVHVVLEGEINKNGQHLPDTGIGWGVYNPDSLYKIRLLNHRYLQSNLYHALLCETITVPPITTTTTTSSTAATMAGPTVVVPLDNEQRMKMILQHHLSAAIQVRRHGLGLPNQSNDTYRLVNGEGDGLSGLAIDVIGNQYVVIMSSAGWCERYKESILQVLSELPITTSKEQQEQNPIFVWKTTPSRLQQDGYVQQKEESADTSTVDNNDAPMVVCYENGIAFETFPTALGQKTGFYCDQRENRARLALHCRNKRVLDLCCYTGGFAIQAAAQGAIHCTGIDSSSVAIQTCHNNAKRNELDHIVDFVQSDVSDYLQREDCPEYDVVVLDPPKLAPSVKMLDKASRKYHALNRDAIKVVNRTEGGLLLTCTCSAAMTQTDGGQYFLRTVQAAALAAERHITLLSTHGAASCHTQSPTAYPASDYLTAALFYVHPA